MRFGVIIAAVIYVFTLPVFSAGDLIYIAADTGKIKSRPADEAYLSSPMVVIIPA